MESTLLLLPVLALKALQKWKLGFLVSLYLLGAEFAPVVPAGSYFESHTVSLYLVAPGEVCPGASIAALQQRVPGPR